MKDKEQPVERPAPKPPIYPVAVIEVACRALEALTALAPMTKSITPAFHERLDRAVCTAVDIIADGLASHERAIKGES